MPSNSGARAEAPESVLGMVRLVEVVLKPGSLACPPFSSARAESGDQFSLGVAGAEGSGNFHQCSGREHAKVAMEGHKGESVGVLARKASTVIKPATGRLYY